MGRVLTPKECFERIPQKEPFHFVDELISLDENGSVGRYHWREDHSFYAGHFPGDPVTPGVLLIECMAQCSVVPVGIFLQHRDWDEADKMVTLFTDTTIDFSGVVRPGESVTVTSETVFYRRNKLRMHSKMETEDGTTVCEGELAGLGVKR